jgi:hypothetical protein
MAESQKLVDVIYLAACARDARLTRICVASIRYFYPDVPIKLMAGDILQAGLAGELKRYWDVGLVDLPKGDYGWGFVKIEPLFGPPGQSFMVCDVDTVFTGSILDVRAESDAPFFVDDEQLSVADSKRFYYDWEEMGAIDSKVVPAIPAFNVGQWFGTAGLVKREDFDGLIEWTLPRRLPYQNFFMGGDQGVMNYVILKKEKHNGLRVERHPIMRWPGYPNGLDGLTAETIAARTAPPRVIHWAGVKNIFLKKMAGADILQFYEDLYYSRLPFGRIRKVLALFYHVWLNTSYGASVPFRLKWRKVFGRPPKHPPALVTENIRS